MEAIALAAEIDEFLPYEPNDLVVARLAYMEHSARVQQIRTLFAQVREHVIRADFELLVAQLAEYAFCNPMLPYVTMATRKEVAAAIRTELDAGFADRKIELDGRECLEVQLFFRRLVLPSGGSLVQQLSRHFAGDEELLGMLRAKFLVPGHLPPEQLSSDEIELLTNAYTGRTGAFRFGMQALRSSLEKGIELLSRHEGTAWTYEPRVLEDLKALRALTVDANETVS